MPASHNQALILCFSCSHSQASWSPNCDSVPRAQKELFAPRLTPSCCSTLPLPNGTSDNLLALWSLHPRVSILARQSVWSAFRSPTSSTCTSCCHSLTSTLPPQPSMQATHPSCSSAAQTLPCTARRFAATTWPVHPPAAASCRWWTSTPATLRSSCSWQLLHCQVSLWWFSGPPHGAPASLSKPCESRGLVWVPKVGRKSARTNGPLSPNWP